MKCPVCKHEFKDPGRVKGGMVSRRTITKDQQAKMQAGRKKKRDVGESKNIADKTDGTRCAVCEQRNSSVRHHVNDDGSLTIWHCNVVGCANFMELANERG
jgi:hypothetical protein